MKVMSYTCFFLLGFYFVVLSGCSPRSAMVTKTQIKGIATMHQNIKPITIAIVGDSTVADYPLEDELRGWGQMLPEFFNENVTIRNFARCGESSKSFIINGYWEEALRCPADYYFIQFGHNDCPWKGDRATDPDTDYQDYLRKYIRDVKAKNATAILVTSMERREFSGDGTIVPSLQAYSGAIKKVARECDSVYLDLHDKSIEFYEKLGEEKGSYLNTSADRTHFTEAGARDMARILVSEIKKKCPFLGLYLLE